MPERRFPVSGRTFKEICIEFSNNTTIHGIKEFAFDDHPNLKFGWLCLFLTCIGAMIFAVTTMSQQFATSPTASSVNHILPTTFPPVLFCPKYWINETRAKEDFGMDDDLLEFFVFMSWVNLEWYHGNKVAKQFDLPAAREKYYDFRRNHSEISSVQEIYQLIALDADDVISHHIPIECELETVTPVVRASSVCYRADFFNHNSTMDYFMNVNCFIYHIDSKHAWTKMDDVKSWSDFPSFQKRENQNEKATPDVKSTSELQENLEISYPPYFPAELPYHKVYLGSDAEAMYSENDYPIRAGESFMMKIKAQVQNTMNCTGGTVADKLTCTLQCRRKSVEQTFGCKFFFGMSGNDTDENYCILNPNATTLDDVVNQGNMSITSPSMDACFSACKFVFNFVH